MLATLVAMQAVLVTPRFSPPLGVPIRIVVERVESLPAVRRYRMETIVRFAREGDGYRAEVRIAGTGAETPGELASMVDHGLATMTGRTIVIHFDKRGQIAGIDDLARLWERFCQAVAENAASRRNLSPEQAATLAARIAAPLRAFPEQKQRDTVGALVTAAFVLEPVEPAGTSRAVQLPGASPFGGSVTLNGTRTTRAVAGALEISVEAEADITMPAEGATPARAGHAAIARRRSFDPATGLVRQAEDTVRTTSGSGAEAHVTTLVTTTHIILGDRIPN